MPTRTSKEIFTSAVSFLGSITQAGAVTNTGGLIAAPVALSDADATILAANSGKVHVIADVTADRTFTLPASAGAAGLVFEFVPDLGAADGHDWIFDTGSDTNYFTGGVGFLDVANAISTVASDQDSNSILQVNVPASGTSVKFVSNGTTWNVSGVVVAAAAPAFSDQA